MAFSEVVVTPPGCYSEELAFATVDNKDVMYKFLDGIKAMGGTDYIIALHTAFKLLNTIAESHPEKTRRKCLLAQRRTTIKSELGFAITKVKDKKD